MADPKSLPDTDRTVSEIGYKPISGLAVAAIVVAGLFTALLLVTSISAFVKKRPVLDIQFLALAGLGLFLAVVARAHIHRSEGARGGLKLVSVAWWMSVVGGAAFAAYYYASSLSLKKQSEAVALEWFDRMKKQQFDEAFVLTLDPKARQNIKADDLTELDARFGGGALPVFRNSELVRMMQRNGEDVTITPLGIGEWQPIPDGYRMESRFQLACAEGIFEIRLNMVGAEGETIDGRQWFIAHSDDKMPATSRTTFGRKLLELKNEANLFAENWIDALRQKQPGEVILGTLAAQQRPAHVLMLCAQRVTENVIRQPLPAILAASLLVPLSKSDESMMERVYASLNARDFFQADSGKFLTEEQKKRLAEAWKLGSFQRAGGQRLQNPETSPQLYVTPQKIRCTFPVEFALPGSPTAFAAGRVVVVSTVPELVNELQELKAQGKSHPGQADTSPDPLLNSPDRQWRILRIETNLETLSVPRMPTAPPPGAQ